MTVSLGQLLPPTECALISSVACVAYTSVPESVQNNLAYHCLKVHEVAVTGPAPTSWLFPSKQHCKVVTYCSEGEVAGGRGPTASGGRDGPLACRK